MIEGEIPNPIDPPRGCAFHPRCPLAFDRCRVELPALRAAGRGEVACHIAAGDANLPDDVLRLGILQESPPSRLQGTDCSPAPAQIPMFERSPVHHLGAHHFGARIMIT